MSYKNKYWEMNRSENENEFILLWFQNHNSFPLSSFPPEAEMKLHHFT